MKLKDETGLAFPLVLIVVLVLTILGVTLYTFSRTETSQVLLDENKMKAHYIARSGAHAVAGYIIENPGETIINSEGQEVPVLDALAEAGESEQYSFAGGYYRVEVGKVNNDNNGDEDDNKEKYVVKSTGTYNNVSQRIEVTVENVGVSGALYANKITVTGGGGAEVIGGDIIAGGTEGVDYSKEDVEGLLTGDDELRNYSYPFEPVILPCEDGKIGFSGCNTWDFASNADPETGDYDENDDLVIPDVGSSAPHEVRYRNIDIGNPGSLTIEPPVGEDLLLRAEHIRVHNAPITVKLGGDNTVYIVADHFEFSDIYVESVEGNEEGGFLVIYAHIFENTGNQNDVVIDSNCNLNVYIYDDEHGEGGTFDIRGVPHFKGAVYAPTAGAVLTGTAQVTGWIITDEITFTGGGHGGIDQSDIEMRDTSLNFDFFNIERWRYVGN